VNYWTPLQIIEENEEEEEEEMNTIKISSPIEINNKSNKWTRRIDRRKEWKLVIDSGATSHFVPEEMNLPKQGTSKKEVYLPDNSKLKASYTTQLPFTQLSNKAREADILPGLKTPLLSVNKMAEEGYLTIFHPGEQGVTIHSPGSVSIITKSPPVLQGCKPKGAKLWTISDKDESTKESANNVYDLPSINQTVKYLHAAAGFPTRETWLKAINAGNFATWPTITSNNVRRHFPESDETAKGHMKKQRQGVRSTRVLEDPEKPYPPLQKSKTSTSKFTMQQKRYIPIKLEDSQQPRAKETNTSWYSLK
jgi:hypothetical protein